METASNDCITREAGELNQSVVGTVKRIQRAHDCSVPPESWVGDLASLVDWTGPCSGAGLVGPGRYSTSILVSKVKMKRKCPTLANNPIPLSSQCNRLWAGRNVRPNDSRLKLKIEDPAKIPTATVFGVVRQKSGTYTMKGYPIAGRIRLPSHVPVLTPLSFA
jgi:hypothetical protein